MAARSRRAPRTAGRRGPRGAGRAGLLGWLALGLVSVLGVLSVAAEPGGPSTLLQPRSPAVVVTPTADQAGFIRRVGSVARRYRPAVGLPPSLVTAIAINETGWGSSGLSRRAYNYFGIKADVGSGTAGRVVEETREVLDGRWVTVRAAFRAYNSLEESVQDLGAFLHANPRYDPIWAVADDPRATARALARAGYATDPDWPEKLTRLIDAFDLEAIDAPFW